MVAIFSINQRPYGMVRYHIYLLNSSIEIHMYILIGMHRTYVLEDLNFHRTVDLFLCTITTYRTLLIFFYFQENYLCLWYCADCAEEIFGNLSHESRRTLYSQIFSIIFITFVTIWKIFDSHVTKPTSTTIAIRHIKGPIRSL